MDKKNIEQLIDNIFIKENFKEENINEKYIRLYKSNEKNTSNYFLVNFIDCSSFEEDKTELKKALDNLEDLYSGKESEENSLEEKINNIIVSRYGDAEGRTISKNMSVIYVLQFENLENLKLHRNSIYAIEESPYYFKRYILPYAHSQLDELKDLLKQRNNGVIKNLNDIVNFGKRYDKLLEGHGEGSAYELVVRLFSKIPFLSYEFRVIDTPTEIDKDILVKVKELENKYNNLELYHKIINEKENIEIDEESIVSKFLKLEDNIKEEELLNKLEEELLKEEVV